MIIDPFLYLAFGAGFLAGRLTSARPRWVNWLLWLDIGLLVFFLGVSVGPALSPSTLWVIPLSVGFALLILGVTIAIVLLFARPTPSGTQSSTRLPLPVGLLVLVGLIAGLGAGRLVALPAGSLLTYSLYALMVLIAFDLKLTRAALRRIPVPLAAASAGAVGAAALYSLATGTSLSVSLATSLAFGWYTLAGPVVATRVGATAGLLAFLTNFLRENLTMALAPTLGRRLGASGLTAMGGATTMDTTLYFVTTYGDRDAGSLALASGFVLTVVASLLVPAVVGLAGA